MVGEWASGIGVAGSDRCQINTLSNDTSRWFVQPVQSSMQVSASEPWCIGASAMALAWHRRNFHDTQDQHPRRPRLQSPRRSSQESAVQGACARLPPYPGSPGQGSTGYRTGGPGPPDPLEMAMTTSMGISPCRCRHKSSSRQWSAFEAQIATRLGLEASVSRQSI